MHAYIQHAGLRRLCNHVFFVFTAGSGVPAALRRNAMPSRHESVHLCGVHSYLQTKP